jgi:transcriptional regulator with XRE-family HTH domain
MSTVTGNLSAILEVARDRRDLPAPSMRRAIRQSAGLSLTDVARAVGVSRQAVAAWETGKTTPASAHVSAYAELLRELQREFA